MPHSTAFLPPAFIATLPPMHDASADVGSTANTSPSRSAASITRRVTTPAPASIVATGAACPGSIKGSTGDKPLELLRVDDGRARVERDRAAGVAGAAAARDDRQAELDAALDQAAHFLLGIGMKHDERILDAPVGRVRHVRDARQSVERDVVAMGVAREHPPRAAAQVGRRGEGGRKPVDGGVRARDEPGHLVVAPGVAGGRLATALLDFGQAVAQRVDEQRLPLRIVEQVVLQVGIALDHPDVAQHFEQHAGGAAGTAFAAQFVEELPHVGTQEPDDDLAVRVRRVVVRDLAQARSVRAGGGRFDEGVGDGVHFDLVYRSATRPGRRGIKERFAACRTNAALVSRQSGMPAQGRKPYARREWPQCDPRVARHRVDPSGRSILTTDPDDPSRRLPHAFDRRQQASTPAFDTGFQYCLQDWTPRCIRNRFDSSA